MAIHTIQVFGFLIFVQYFTEKYLKNFTLMAFFLFALTIEGEKLYFDLKCKYRNFVMQYDKTICKFTIHEKILKQ